MQTRRIPGASRFTKLDKYRRIWRKIVSFLACIVVFCTTYALILPAITMEKPVVCGMEEHSHTEKCYAQTEEAVQMVIQCTALSHAHTEECQDAQGNLTCMWDAEFLHQHNTSCRNEAGELICPMEEKIAHTHEDSCYAPAELHVHGESCYSAVRGELTCLLEETEGHTHGEGCSQQTLTCTLSEEPAHTHGEACWSREQTCTEEETASYSYEETVDNTLLVCTVTEEGHEHADACYETTTTVQTVEVKGHTHGDSCYETTLTCQLSEEAHTHGDTCYAATVTCTLEETEGHAHADACYVLNQELTCGKDEQTVETEQSLTCTEEERIPHIHDDDCFAVQTDEDGTEYTVLSCPRPQVWEHYHSDECIGTTTASVDPETLTCTLAETQGHTHDETCLDETGLAVCGQEESAGHTHNALCYGQWELVCVMAEHTHTDGCYAELMEEELLQIEAVIEAIDAMPFADEIDDRIAEFETVEDYEGEEEWLAEVYQQVAEVYQMYSDLGEELQPFVTNADKLLELEYIWSVATLIEDINSDAPTTTWYTSTKDFVELNLYDYTYGINTRWDSDKKYPGFQWNGGAYSKIGDYRYTSSYYATADDGIPNALTDRYYIDSIDFGNSIITNYEYGGSDYDKSTTAIGVGKLYNNSGASATGKINWLWYDGSDYATTTNRPVGYSTGYGSLSRTLVNGYPALDDGSSLAYLFGGTDDSYVIKQNTSSIDGLFQRDEVTGEYSYNSRENHAQYSNNFFTLYDQIITPNFITYPFGNFLPLNTISDLSQATQVGAFNEAGGMKNYVEGIIADLDEDLARDDDGNGTDADYGDTSRKQLKIMLQEYRENWNWYPNNNYGTFKWDDLSSAMAIRDYFNGVSSGGDTPSADVSFVAQEHLDNMYNIDWDVATNFFFGMEMKMNFMQPKNGYTGNDTNGDGESDYPMVFYFTGDDDVWVYIDDVLFLDLTGIHRHVGGKIDFVNGKVYYYELQPSTTGDVSESEYAWYSFAAILRAAGWTEAQIDEVLKPENSAGNRPFKDYTTHSFNFYYTERGSGSSVCRLNFNFPLLKKNSLTVTKENVTTDGESTDGIVQGNPDYYFNIVTPNNTLFVGPNSATGVSTYKVKDSAGNILKNEDGTDKVFTVDQYGIFTLKAGQTAVFEGIEENEGKYFVQELIKEEDNAQYPTVYVNDAITRYNDLIDWSHRTYFSDTDDDKHTGPYGYKWYGRSGYDTDSSTSSSFYFEQQNRVDVSKLGKLSITKSQGGVTTIPEDKIFMMNVALDGEPIPAGTSYTLNDGSTGTVTTAGIIELKAGQTATISNIISGTKFTVSEDSGSAEGYVVTYEQENADEAEVTSNGVTGVIRVNTTVAVEVTNTVNADKVEISGTKTVSNGNLDASESGRTYTFTLTQVADAQGGELTEGMPYSDTKSVTVKGTDTGKFLFEIPYGATTQTGTYYYKITEDDPSAEDVIKDDVFYIAIVTVTKNEETGLIDANLESLTKSDGTVVESAAFANTLTGDLSLQKLVDGSQASQTDKTFDFTFTFTDANGNPLTGTYSATAQNKDDTVQSFTASLDETGSVTFINFYHGESITIHGLPAGTTWKVKEVSADGYIVSWTVNGTETANVDNSVSGKIPNAAIQVVCTNTTTYILPETGGVGTTTYTMAGLMLMLLSMAFLLYRFSKRRREAV